MLKVADEARLLTRVYSRGQVVTYGSSSQGRVGLVCGMEKPGLVGVDEAGGSCAP